MNTTCDRGADISVPRVARSPLALWLARKYVRRSLANHFDGVYVSGLARAQELCRERSVIIAPNHVSWWDAFIAVLLDQALGTEGYCLMDAQNLRRLPFFSWLGAIALARDDAAAAVRDLSASLSLLTGPGRALWIFPQGRQRPPHLRPMGLQSGAAFLAQHSRVPVVPVSISYAYLDAPRPCITVRFGSPIDAFATSASQRASWKTWLAMLESRLGEGLDANDRFVLASADREAKQGAMVGPNELYVPLVAARNPSSDTPTSARWLAFFAGRARVKPPSPPALRIKNTSDKMELSRP